MTAVEGTIVAHQGQPVRMPTSKNLRVWLAGKRYTATPKRPGPGYRCAPDNDLQAARGQQ